jgi:hypothetical protein
MEEAVWIFPFFISQKTINNHGILKKLAVPSNPATELETNRHTIGGCDWQCHCRETRRADRSCVTNKCLKDGHVPSGKTYCLWLFFLDQPRLRDLRRNKDPLQALYEMIPVIGDYGLYYLLRFEPCDPEAGS